ncbi:hypothetical protein PENTCL1PPCAC_16642, partial [Pristionchus entomophagus]
TLFILFIYLLLRLGLSNNVSFNTPFFHWFLLAGFYSSISVLVFVIATRFNIAAEYAWTFKVAYIINTFGAIAATIGKVYMSAHRFSVMKSNSFGENVWNRSFTIKLVMAQLILSGLMCGQIFFCGYAYTVKDGMKYVIYVDDKCIGNTKRLLAKSQRYMFIDVSVCSITHLVKAIHQMCWVLVAVFQLHDFSTFLQDTFIYTHYLSTYSGAVTLVLFNSRVRWLLVSFNWTDGEKGIPRVASQTR